VTLLPDSRAGQAPDAAPVPDADTIRAAFDGVSDMTVGLEEEVLLVDREHRRLASRAAEVLDRLQGDPRFKPELPAAQLELLTPPVKRVGAAARILAEGRRELVDRAGDLAVPIGCGAPPVGALEGELSPGERYSRILDSYRVIARRQLVCALQIHVAVRGAERALAVYNALRSHLPEIAALAANAPLQGGMDTGMASIRPTISAMLPRQGVPPTIVEWEAFAEDLRWGAAAGGVPEVRRWWWELRPHPAFGTLEVRVADTQMRPSDSAAVAAFVHCLVAWLAARHDAGEPLAVDSQWRIAENRWAAARDGVEGEMADLQTGVLAATRTVLKRQIEQLAPFAQDLGCAAELEGARALCEANGAARQRAFAQEHGVPALLAWLAEEFAPTR
jgi:carboxylate-amine ligase